MDYNFYQQILNLSIIKLVLMSGVSGKEGECHKKEWIDNKYVDEIYCCSNYEMNNGNCIKCGKGFISKDGGSCQSCPGNAYGTQCLQSCICTELQICHHAEGCITLQSTSSFETNFEVNTANYQSLTTSAIEVKEGDSTEPSLGPVSFNQNIVIYSVCIAGLLFVITICYICISRLRYKGTEQKKESNRQQTGIQNAANLIAPIPESFIRVESIYDEIDEISLNDVLQKSHSCILDDFSSDETSEEEHADLTYDDYLNPYQPIVKDFERHYYNDVTDHGRYINLDKIIDSGKVDKRIENNHLENAVNEHDYLDVIDVVYEDRTIYTNSTKVTDDYTVQLCTKTNCAKTLIIQNNEYPEKFPSNEYKTKVDEEEEGEVPELVSNKRLPI